MCTHTTDAAAILDSLRARPAVVIGTSAGAAIAIDLTVRRPDLVRVAIAHEFPWRFTRHPPTREPGAFVERACRIRQAAYGRRSAGEGGLLGHDGAKHVQLRGPAGGPDRGEHAGQRGEHDDDDEGRHGEPERLETLV
jgi:pimeloyl-ACP methyl ester carboxylesterase